MSDLGAVYAWVGKTTDDDSEHIVCISTATIAPLPLVTESLETAQTYRPVIARLSLQLQTPFRLVAYGAAVTMETIVPLNDEEDSP